MEQTNDLTQEKTEGNVLGSYLIEAGLITSNQLDEALREQKNNTHMRLGEILVKRGWIEQKTINYFIEKIIAPTRQNLRDRHQRKSIAKFFHPHQVKREENISASDMQLSYRRLILPTFYLSPKRVSRFLLSVIILLVLASLLTESAIYFLNSSTSNGYTGRMFVLDEEANIPTVYSTLTLLFCSILLAIISYLKKVDEARYPGYWKFLSWLFLFLALDEFCSIHETFISPLRKALNASGVLYFAWVVPAFIFLLIFLLAFLKFIKALPQKTRNLFIKAGTIYISGTLGMEMISGYYSSNYGENNIVYSVITTIEESLEMLGIVVFIYALLSYIKLQIAEVEFSICFKRNNNEQGCD